MTNYIKASAQLYNSPHQIPTKGKNVWWCLYEMKAEYFSFFAAPFVNLKLIVH